MWIVYRGLTLRNSYIEYFVKCPKKYDLSVNKKLETIHDPAYDNALICGSALHLGAETGDVKTAINYYYDQFSIITDKHENEVIKLEYFTQKLINLISTLGDEMIHEIKFNFGSFYGTADLLVKNDNGSYTLYDYKYSNNIDIYCQSRQLHIYKYFLEKMGYKIDKIAFIFIPKTFIRQKKTETIGAFHNRLRATISQLDIKIKYLEYDVNNVITALVDGITALETTEYKPNPTRLCDWCNFKKYCLEGDDLEMLPSIERRNISKIETKVNWFYGAPFSGKTSLADKYPTPLLLNTDGNFKLVSMPFIHIKDEITTTGRVVNKKFAWQVFKDAITELEKGGHGFETVVVDLLEDTKEMARVYMYDKLGIEHESDNSFKAWDMIRNEWLNTIKRIVALPMNVVFLSHEDQSKDVTKRSGDKVTRIAPNLSEKESLKVSGMVDFVARIVNDNGDRYITFKSSPVEFGGGRLDVTTGEKLQLTYDSIEKIYSLHNKNKTVIEEVQPIEDVQNEETVEEKPKKTRKTRKAD